MLDVQDIQTRADRSLLDRPLGEIVDGIVDGGQAWRDMSLAVLASTTGASCLVAACAELADRPECQPRLLDLARVLARARYLRQQLPVQIDDLQSAQRDLDRARGLPHRDAHDSASRRTAVQLTLRHTLSRRLEIAGASAELACLAGEARMLSGEPDSGLTGLARLWASTALTRTIESVERELGDAREPFLCEYVASDLARLRHELCATSALGDTRGIPTGDPVVA
ncbi:MAG: hypothetical protein U0821_22250 [Chloroflexota bacterium]